MCPAAIYGPDQKDETAALSSPAGTNRLPAPHQYIMFGGPALDEREAGPPLSQKRKSVLALCNCGDHTDHGNDDHSDNDDLQHGRSSFLSFIDVLDEQIRNAVLRILESLPCAMFWRRTVNTNTAGACGG